MENSMLENDRIADQQEAETKLRQNILLPPTNLSHPCVSTIQMKIVSRRFVNHHLGI